MERKKAAERKRWGKRVRRMLGCGLDAAWMQAARARTEGAFGVQFGRREERGGRNGTLPAASLLRVRAAMPQNEQLGCLASEKNGLAKNGEGANCHACRLQASSIPIVPPAPM